ncbi:MAG: phosphoribosylglycinamide formyltransferase [Salinivirgaceae bacterium]|nr:phosphoribosylglycinamide formyltransferase [Salinivirgaceae bacterium]MDD4745939.1 phosphoribosylglycinamide formyltransferase [Salinivirgaceae bacterium]MDY0279747.1 phosphoribosylglycinamide formyltransferase [Salinivirgaceae bacterium]
MIKKNIAIFASGSGSNAEVIVKHFKQHSYIDVSCIFTNNKDAYVLQRANKLNIPAYIFVANDIKQNGRIAETLENERIDFIILAGYMKLIPEWMVYKYKNRIVNIHPALLPKYGGKGMYGSHVHEAVINAQESETGITIHIVNNEYDKGGILYQASCPILPNDNPKTLAERIHKLEHQHYPRVIENYILSLNVSK